MVWDAEPSWRITGLAYENQSFGLRVCVSESWLKVKLLAGLNLGFGFMVLMADSSSINKTVLNISNCTHLQILKHKTLILLIFITPVFSRVNYQLDPNNNTKMDKWFPIRDMSRYFKSREASPVTDKKLWITFTSQPSQVMTEMERWAAAPMSAVRASLARSAAPVSTLGQDSGMHVLTDRLSQET